MSDETGLSIIATIVLDDERRFEIDIFDRRERQTATFDIPGALLRVEDEPHIFV